jgi:D-hexose-6-phosphate mutarotase
MSNETIDRLNERFGQGDRLRFGAGPGGLALAQIRNPQATATVALQGGQVLGFQPHGVAPVLWVSRAAVYTPGKPIRGGIPICWPWFGPHPSDPAKPNHGFVRGRVWAVRETSDDADGTTRLTLGIGESDETRALWPHAFDLRVEISVGAELEVALIARNTGAEPFVCTGALHSYFGVDAVQTVQIEGLEGRDYLDTANRYRRARQDGPIRIAAETDRIYLDTPDDCLIRDPQLGRTIRVAKSGSRTTVVWNPWVEKARELRDIADDEYVEMVCVETANAADDQIVLMPGAEHRLAARIVVEL